MKRISAVAGYHAHVYFDAGTKGRAIALCQAASDAFELQMGRVHEKTVGPHPRWSCQLAFDPEHFDRIVPWLMLNRDGLTIFLHGETGDDLVDHTDHAIWMGEMLQLDLSVFGPAGDS